jgi:hypothetical protein
MNKTFEFRWENENASIVLMNPDFEVISPCNDLGKLEEEYSRASNEFWVAFCEARAKLTKPDTSKFKGKPLGAEYFKKWRRGDQSPQEDTGK